MARARNIKPGFFTNDELADLPMATRLLFIGLWTLADREGRFLDRPRKIRMEIFPADDIDVDEALITLERSAFIQRYIVDGVACIEIVNFTKHQRPHPNESASTLPPPPGMTPEKPHEINNSEVTSNHGEQDVPPRITALCPDTGYLIPDSPFSDSLIPESRDTETTDVVSPSATAEDGPPPAVRSKRSTLDDRFDRFWSVVPRKVGKESALRWWRRKKPNDALTETMIQAMERHKRSPDWLKDGGKSIPYPMTWLNRGGWEDQLGPVETELDNAYVVAFGSDNVQRMADALDRLSPTFAGPGWVRSTLRRMAVDAPELTPEQIKAGMAIALERIELRVRNREKPVMNPTSFAFFTIRQALDEQREVSAA